MLPPFVMHDTYADLGALIATLVVPNPAEGGVATVLGPGRTGPRRFARRHLTANTMRYADLSSEVPGTR